MVLTLPIILYGSDKSITVSPTNETSRILKTLLRLDNTGVTKWFYWQILGRHKNRNGNKQQLSQQVEILRHCSFCTSLDRAVVTLFEVLNRNFLQWLVQIRELQIYLLFDLKHSKKGILKSLTWFEIWSKH